MRVVGRSGVVMDLSESAARGLLRSGAVKLVNDQAAAPAAGQPPPAEPHVEVVDYAAAGRTTTPQSDRPPNSGRGSGLQAWRTYAAAMLGRPVDSFAGMSRDEIIELVDGPR